LIKERHPRLVRQGWRFFVSFSGSFAANTPPASVKYGFRCCVFWLFSGVCEPATLRDVLFACLAARQQPLTTAGGFLFNASIEPKETS